MDDISQTFNTIQPKEYGGTGSSDLSLNATDLRVKDGTDTTKRIAFNASSITTATTRTITMGDADVTLRPQAWEQIGSNIIGTTNVPEIKVQNLSAYVAIRMRAIVRPVNDGVNFLLKVSSDNGSTYYSASPGYTFAGTITDFATSSVAAQGPSTNASMSINRVYDVSNSENRLFMKVEIDLFNKTSVKRFSQHVTWINSAISKELDLNGSGRILSSSALNCFQITTDLGNFDISEFVLEGMRG